MNALIPTLPRNWILVDLPGYRPAPPYATYTEYAYEELPPINVAPDNFAWLRAQPVKEDSLAEDGYAANRERFLARLKEIETISGLTLPAAFIDFMSSSELHVRINSATACYLLLPDFVVRTAGQEEGFLIHFLSDQQWCLHWHLYVNSASEHCVLVSAQAYGFGMDEETADEIDEQTQASASSTLSAEIIDLAKETVWFCAASFAEFIYRFWIENDLWFALNDEEMELADQPLLTPEQQAYLDHYRKPTATE